MTDLMSVQRIRRLSAEADLADAADELDRRGRQRDTARDEASVADADWRQTLAGETFDPLLAAALGTRSNRSAQRAEEAEERYQAGITIRERAKSNVMVAIAQEQSVIMVKRALRRNTDRTHAAAANVALADLAITRWRQS